MIPDHLSDILIVIGFISIGLSVWYSLKKQKTEKDMKNSKVGKKL